MSSDSLYQKFDFLENEGIDTIDTTTARQSFRDLVDKIVQRGQRVVVTRNGRPAVAVVPLRDLERLHAQDRLVDDKMVAAQPLGPKDERKAISFESFVKTATEEESPTGQDQQETKVEPTMAAAAAQIQQETYLKPPMAAAAFTGVYDQPFGEVLETMVVQLVSSRIFDVAAESLAEKVVDDFTSGDYSKDDFSVEHLRQEFLSEIYEATQSSTLKDDIASRAFFRKPEIE